MRGRGREAGKPVGVCGEAAADPALAPVLAGLGVTSLSMAARAVPRVAQALALRTLAECEQLAAAVLAAGSPEAARALATVTGPAPGHDGSDVPAPASGQARG